MLGTGYTTDQGSMVRAYALYYKKPTVFNRVLRKDPFMSGIPEVSCLHDILLSAYLEVQE